MADPKATWLEFYRRALLELDPTRLLESVELAEKAIQSRLREMERSAGGHDQKEAEAIDDALRALRLLRRDSLGQEDD